MKVAIAGIPLSGVLQTDAQFDPKGLGQDVAPQIIAANPGIAVFRVWHNACLARTQSSTRRDATPPPLRHGAAVKLLHAAARAGAHNNCINRGLGNDQLHLSRRRERPPRGRYTGARTAMQRLRMSLSIGKEKLASASMARIILIVPNSHEDCIHPSIVAVSARATGYLAPDRSVDDTHMQHTWIAPTIENMHNTARNMLHEIHSSML
eukprot:6203101-Pleurochrysis_carterae.AAC.3